MSSLESVRSSSSNSTCGLETSKLRTDAGLFRAQPKALMRWGAGSLGILRSPNRTTSSSRRRPVDITTTSVPCRQQLPRSRRRRSRTRHVDDRAVLNAASPRRRPGSGNERRQNSWHLDQGARSGQRAQRDPVAGRLVSRAHTGSKTLSSAVLVVIRCLPISAAGRAPTAGPSRGAFCLRACPR